MSLGTVSLSISSLLVFSSGVKLSFPVTFRPGRARLSTKPKPTRSPAFVTTMGMVVVALLPAKRQSFLRLQLDQPLAAPSRPQAQGIGACFPSAYRYSIVIFFPSVHPSLLNSCRNALHESRTAGSSA